MNDVKLPTSTQPATALPVPSARLPYVKHSDPLAYPGMRNVVAGDLLEADRQPVQNCAAPFRLQK